MSCTCCILSPFRFAEYPQASIFLADGTFYKGASTGQTQSQIASATVARVTRETGRSPGSIMGISAHSDRLIEEGNQKRRAR